MNADKLFSLIQKLPLDQRGTFDIQCGCDNYTLSETKYACPLQEAIGEEFWFVFRSRDAKGWSTVSFNGKVIASAFWTGREGEREPRFFIFEREAK